MSNDSKLFEFFVAIIYVFVLELGTTNYMYNEEQIFGEPNKFGMVRRLIFFFFNLKDQKITKNK